MSGAVPTSDELPTDPGPDAPRWARFVVAAVRGWHDRLGDPSRGVVTGYRVCTRIGGHWWLLGLHTGGGTFHRCAACHLVDLRSR